MEASWIAEVEKGTNLIVWLPEQREIVGELVSLRGDIVVLDVNTPEGALIRWRVGLESIVAVASITPPSNLVVPGK